ncbi:MAG TPA: flagellar hook-associated protein 3 [Chromatiaceae bacterium]|nr:flagellar hook-associated protein 3 [Chromatiaceae bacterium]
MRISTGQWYRQGVNAMLNNQSTLSKTQLQLATGQRMLAPSDDPGAATRVLELDQLLSAVSQYQRNGDAAESRLRREENVLESSGDILQRVRELAVRAVNGSLSAGDRQAIATEAREHLAGLLSMANATDTNGETIFGGYRTDVPAFVDDGAGNFTYQGDQGQRLMQIGSARHVATNDPGSSVYMGIDDGNGGITDAFSILNDFITDLDNNTPSGTTLTALDNAMDQIQTVRTKIGGRMNAIENQRGINDSFGLVMEQNRSILEDLDYGEAVSRLQQQQLILQASQQSFMKVEGLSLFNYL